MVEEEELTHIRTGEILLNSICTWDFKSAGLSATITLHQPTVTYAPQSYGALSEQDTDVRSVSSASYCGQVTFPSRTAG